MSDSTPDLPTKPISELVADPAFPNSALGQKVDIQGFIGVVVEVVSNSIRVRSDAGNTVRYNFNALRRLYGLHPPPETAPIEQTQSAPVVSEPQTKREVIQEPDFHSPLVPIELLVQQPDFPRCALGRFVDLHGFTGVVVELVADALKIRSQQGATRRYNAAGLKKLYGKLRSGPPAKA
jgi:hypothetical protein